MPTDVEAESFLDGLPKGSNELTLRLGDQGGFYGVGRLGKDRALPVEALVLATHGGPGEDGSLQGALDLAGLAYTGPTGGGRGTGHGQVGLGAVMVSAGLPTLPRALLESTTTTLDFDGPYILKPRFGGSSIGIEVVTDLATAIARLSTNPHFTRDASSNRFVATSRICRSRCAPTRPYPCRRSNGHYDDPRTRRSWITAINTWEERAWCRPRENSPPSCPRDGPKPLKSTPVSLLR